MNDHEANRHAQKIARSHKIYEMFKKILTYYIAECTLREIDERIMNSDSELPDETILEYMMDDIHFQQAIRAIRINVLLNVGTAHEISFMTLGHNTEFDILSTRYWDFFVNSVVSHLTIVNGVRGFVMPTVTRSIHTDHRDDYWILGNTGYAIVIENLNPFKIANEQVGDGVRINQFVAEGFRRG